MKTSRCQSLFGCIYPSLFHVGGRSLLRTSQNMTEVGWVILMSTKVFSQLFHSPLAENPTLHCQQCWLFLHSHSHWLAEVWVRSEHLYRLHLCLKNLSMSCASLKCGHPVYIWGYEYDPRSLTLHTGTGSGYPFHIPSISHVSHVDGIREFLFV